MRKRNFYEIQETLYIIFEVYYVLGLVRWQDVSLNAMSSEWKRVSRKRVEFPKSRNGNS